MGGGALRITADTNVLLRTVLQDDPHQAALVNATLAKATLIAVPPTVFCEFAWVLRRGYGLSTDRIADAIKAVCALDVVVTDQSAVDAGLAVLGAGGDFADGVIAHQGRTLGRGTFASFDREAVQLLQGEGTKAADPADLVSD